MNNSISTHYDFDLFFRCGPFTSHYATAGGYVPDDIIFDPRHAQLRTTLLNDKSLNYKYKLNPALDEILAIKFQEQKIDIQNFDRRAYLRDFISFARMGCFSFDRTYILNPNDRHYHLVAYPDFNDNQEQLFPQQVIDEIVRYDFSRPRRLFY